MVPHFAARLGLTQRFRLRGLEASVHADARYVGSTHLSFDPAIDRRSGDYVVAGVGTSVQDGSRRWSMDVENLFDGHGSTFGFGNPFTLRATNQTVPLRPRSITLRLAFVF
ncbi:hypothetical protein [Sphingomonas sp. PvP018]|uniref:hypothetical protein n=1 Tax=Sphingomonas sp. PvP018 TaxID=2817852 RepID=UPI001AE5A6BE|nr:hypothetical protein [Sphingomonas sp. PvP018]MBP2513786.1 hypothetical protein [Sphingomonas sp. PvP018]